MIDGLANLDAVCSATASRTEGGWRALDLRAWDGIDARLLPDRGLDCFGAWYRGVPLAWVSAVGERGRSAGACATTTGCSASAAGWWPRAGCATSARRARATACRRDLPPARARGPRGALGRRRAGHRERVGAVAEVSALGHRLELERTWTTRTGEGRLELVDVTRNLGASRSPRRCSTTSTSGRRCGPRARRAGARRAGDDAARRRRGRAVGPALEPLPGARERVFEHEVRPARTGGARRPSTRPPRGCG